MCSTIASFSARRLVLVVDADALSRGAMQTLMQREGFETDAAWSGVQGLGKAMARSYDLILLATKLPDVNGLLVARRLRAHHSTARTPLVAIADEGDEAVADLALAAGCDDCIAKPVNPVTFYKRVRKSLVRTTLT
jgi:two-component system alkaline phosphatase synthesis response regulator PhoP